MSVFRISIDKCMYMYSYKDGVDDTCGQLHM